MLQNEKCHMLVENETQRLKDLDECHNQQLREWRDQLKPRKKVHVSVITVLYKTKFKVYLLIHMALKHRMTIMFTSNCKYTSYMY